MTIGWAMTGVIWQKNIFMVFVRKSRHTHQLMEELKEFTVFVPMQDLKKQIKYAEANPDGIQDKIALCNFTMLPSKTVSIPHIQGKGITYECRVVFQAEIRSANFLRQMSKVFTAAMKKQKTHIRFILEKYWMSIRNKLA